MAREYFQAYHSYLQGLEPLNDAECGRLFRALLTYSATGACEELRGNERFIFPTMRAQIDRDNQKYEEKCKKNRENGSRSNEQTPPNGTERHRTVPNAPQGKGEGKGEGEDKGIYEHLRALYNETCVSFPKCLSLSDKRKKALSARLKHYSVDDFKNLFEKAEQSSFLKGGNNRSWTATFDWLICDSNMAKVLDGNYDDRKEKTNDWGLDLDRQDF